MFVALRLAIEFNTYWVFKTCVYVFWQYNYGMLPFQFTQLQAQL